MGKRERERKGQLFFFPFAPFFSLSPLLPPIPTYLFLPQPRRLTDRVLTDGVLYLLLSPLTERINFKEIGVNSSFRNLEGYFARKKY